MMRSKLEMYIDVLKFLSDHGPQKITHIAYKANMSHSVLSGFLEFLMKHGLVEKRPVGGKRVVYAITRKGTAAVKKFSEFKRQFPVPQ